MFEPKKAIPKLAVAALALTGCGSDGGAAGGTGGTGATGGTGGTGGDGDFATSLSAFCMNAAPCWGYTPEECAGYYNQVNEVNNDAQCTAALISYFDCGAAETCDDILAGACDAEYYAVWDGTCSEI